MASGIQIGKENYRNPLDGLNAQVDLSGVPTGTLSFWISRTPVFATAFQASSYTMVAPVNSPAVTYNIAVPVAALYYIWAVDFNGVASGNPAAVFVGMSNEVDENLIGYWLRDTMIANQAAIEAYVQQYFKGQTIKQILFGNPTSVEDWPCIYVAQPSCNEDYVAAPYGREFNFRTVISAICMHQDRQTALAYATQLGSAIKYILNTPPYEEVALASGTTIYRCQIMSATYDDISVSENKWAAGAELIWTSNAFIIDTKQGLL